MKARLVLMENRGKGKGGKGLPDLHRSRKKQVFALGERQSFRESLKGRKKRCTDDQKGDELVARQ